MNPGRRRVAWVTAVVLGVAAGLASSLDAAAPDERLPEFALATDTPDAGVIIDANLLVPTPDGWTGGTVEITLAGQSGLYAWFRASGETCATAKTKWRKVWSAPLPADVVAPACVEKSGAGAGRSLATVLYRPAAGAPVARVVASPPISLEAHELGSAWLALLSAAFGFLAGILTQVFQTWWAARQEATAAEHEIAKTVALALVPEMTANRQRLQAYLAAAGAAPAQSLDTGAYNGLFGTKGVLAYLTTTERAAYLAALDQLYARDIARYNHLVLAAPQDPVALRAAATRLEPKLGEFLP